MKMNVINFDKKKETPLYEQIYHKLQEDILSGYLKKGDQLPSIRKAMTLFRVSKTSVERAYDALMLEGWIKAMPQKGYFVDVDTQHVALRKELLQSSGNVEKEIVRYDFRSQSMDMDAFDINLWKKYIKDILDHHQEIGTYGDAQGEAVLRHALCEYAYSMRGVLCRDEQILIGSSFQSLLYVLCGLLHRPAVFGMQEDGFLPFQTVCEDYAIPIKPFPMDEEGIVMEALYQSDIDLLYINSVSCGYNHQPISAKRRKELLAWAKEKQVWIVEDDHNGELRYHTRMTPAMQGFDDGEHVIYIGSFSKLLLPSLRISYMVLPTSLYRRYQKREKSYSPTASKIEQLAFAHYIADGHLERHVKRLRKRYSRKSQYMLQLLKQHFQTADIYLDESALQFILRIKESYRVSWFLHNAKKNGIQITISKQEELILSFAAIPQEDMEEAVRELSLLFAQAIEHKEV